MIGVITTRCGIISIFAFRPVVGGFTWAYVVVKVLGAWISELVHRCQKRVCPHMREAVHVAPYSIKVVEIKLTEGDAFLATTLGNNVSPRVDDH